MSQEVKLLTTEKGKLEKVENVYWMYYNPLKYKSNSEIEIQISDDVPYTDVSVRAGCQSCTKAFLNSQGNTHTVKITYDTTIINPFTKTVTFKYTVNGERKQETIKITGKVER